VHFGERCVWLTPQKRRPFAAQDKQDRRTPYRYLIAELRGFSWGEADSILRATKCLSLGRANAR